MRLHYILYEVNFRVKHLAGNIIILFFSIHKLYIAESIPISMFKDKRGVNVKGFCLLLYSIALRTHLYTHPLIPGLNST